MDFSTFLEQTEPADVIVRDVKLPTGGVVADSITLRPCDRAALDALRKQAMNPRAKAGEDPIDPQKLRLGLIRQCVVDWSGVTYGRAALAMGRKPTSISALEADTPIPFAIDIAIKVLGALFGVEDMIWAACIQRVEADAKNEADEKNG